MTDMDAQNVNIFSIGYGKRSIDEFVRSLKQFNISFLVDVRSAPYSRYKPEFSKDALQDHLKNEGIRYVFMGNLLGGRPTDPECQDALGKVDYGRVRKMPFYEKGIGRIQTAHNQNNRLALMCAEGKPENCHRSKLIGVSLADLAIPIGHIDENDQLQSQQAILKRLAQPKAAATGDELRDLLKQVFGFDDFRPNQRPIIENILANRDTLVIMPTGAGKSLCYQLPALLLDGVSVVVSPLISLMQDQVTQLHSLDVAATYLNSTVPNWEYQERMESVRNGTVKMLYVAPETLLRSEILNLLGQTKLAAVVIDEAHCISSWGHDFRPEYRQIVSVRERFPEAVCVALTATATPRVREDIKQSLNFQQQNSFISSFDRPNLFLEVRPKSDRATQIVQFIRERKGESGIIYCATRKTVDQLHRTLEANGISSRPYHAGMEKTDRATNQTAFIRDDVPIIVATVAFGMGIDKPNVRWVIHADLPKNLESYYQEIGRAGRDSLPSNCLMLWSFSEVMTHRSHIQNGSLDEADGRTFRLNAMIAFAQSGVCRRRELLTYFGEKDVAETCTNCDNCTQEKGSEGDTDITELAQKFLSTVVKTDQRFGMSHIINVLRGSQAQNIKKWGHDTLSVHGIGKEHSKKAWQHIANQLLAQGVMRQETTHLSIKITDDGWATLKGEAIFGTLLDERAKATRVARQVQQAQEMGDYDMALFELLKQKRKALADADNVPPYVIFSDASLVEMAFYLPGSAETFAAINGVGRIKLEKYAPIFVPLIRDYCVANNLKEIARPDAILTKAPPKVKQGLSPRTQEIGDAFANGVPLAGLIEHFGIKQNTIVKHLETYHQTGKPIDGAALYNDSPIPEELKAQAKKEFARLGTDRLRPVYDAMNEQISFDDLKLLRLAYISSPK